MLNVEDLQKQMDTKQRLYINDLMRCFRKDPTAEDWMKGYSDTENLLIELIEKDGSVLAGLIPAIEYYLDK